MSRTPLAIALASAAALSGCEQQEVTINTGLEDNVATNDVVLPPSIAASKIYRCKDNSVVYIDWLSDQKTANVRTEENGHPTQVTTVEPGKPLTAPTGLSVTGTAAAPSISVTLPGGSAKTCKA